MHRHGPVIVQCTDSVVLLKPNTGFKTGFWLPVNPVFIYSVLHGMQTRSSDENSVRPSVCQTREL